MKRFASHYLFLPGNGFLKQVVIEVENGSVRRIFPLAEEIESVEWLPGVIALCREALAQQPLIPGESPVDEIAKSRYPLEETFQKDNGILCTLPSEWEEKLRTQNWMAFLLFPFDFTSMRPAAGTQRRQLR